MSGKQSIINIESIIVFMESDPDSADYFLISLRTISLKTSYITIIPFSVLNVFGPLPPPPTEPLAAYP